LDIRHSYDYLDRTEDEAVLKAGSTEENHAESETIRKFDVLNISLMGMGAIVWILLIAVALPVFGFPYITDKLSFAVIVITALCGMAYLSYTNVVVYKLINDHDRLMGVLLNSLGQGFLTFDKNGICDDVYSYACIDLLGVNPDGKEIWEVLAVPEEGIEDFKGWLDILFMHDHALGFADVVNFLPKIYPHPQNRKITLEYKQIRSDLGDLKRVVLIATDITEEYEAQDLAQKRQDFADMICRIFKERNHFLTTITQIRSFLEQAGMTVTKDNAPPLLRLLHTLKASAKHFHLKYLANLIHSLESDLRNEGMISDSDFKKTLAAGRIAIEKELNNILDSLKGIVGQDYEKRGNSRDIEESTLYNFALVMGAQGVGRDIIEYYLRFIVAVPLRESLRQFDRELVDLAEISGKHLKPVKYVGYNPPILLREYQNLVTSLTHISRNILDHGIEPPVTRISLGKDPSGQVIVDAAVLKDEEGRSWLRLCIEDDGGGIDPNIVRNKMSILQPDKQWYEIDDHEVIQSIFEFGLSTRENVSDMSGRGVGLNVVKREVENLNGNIEVFSELHKGTRFEIRVPYILAISQH